MFEYLTLNFFYKALTLNLSLLLLLRFIFLRNGGTQDIYKGLFLFGFSVFFVTYLLKDIDMSMGFAFGLFAIFSVLRYRTETLGAKDMTYLFTTIALSLIASVAPLGFIELSSVCLLICGFAFILELNLFSPTIREKSVVYENIENIRPENYNKLIDDLKNRTGLDIKSVSIGDVNFINDSATVKIRY